MKVLESGSGGAEYEMIYREVVQRSFVERVAILEQAGLTVSHDGTYAITARGLALATRINRLRRLCAVTSSGIYFSGRR